MEGEVNLMGFTDWQEPMEKLFALTTITAVAELGLGEGTQWFLDRCAAVLSIEFAAQPEHEPWHGMMFEKYKDYRNWGSTQYKVKDEYSKEIRDIVDFHIHNDSYDLIFVDPGIHCRADLVNQLFGRAPIIAAHDTERGHDKYEWAKIAVPPDYYEYRYTNGEGVRFWFQDKELHKKFTEAFQ
jgi:hypothetical protein